MFEFGQAAAARENPFVQELQSQGFTVIDFPEKLRLEMLDSIVESLSDLHPEAPHTPGESLAAYSKKLMQVPDSEWGKRMNRAFRIFSPRVARDVTAWARDYFLPRVGRKEFAVNAIIPQEAEINRQLTLDDLAIYWRCVRPGKEDAGRPHRDSSFWELELEEGYDPRLPFKFRPLEDCLKLWIPLYGCTRETALQMVPNSHREHIPIQVVATDYGRRPTISNDWLEENGSRFYTSPRLQTGTGIVFDMDTVHNGPRHNGDTVRISAELNLIFK